MKFLILLGMVFMSVLAFAQTAPPETYEGLMGYLGAFAEAVGKGDWRIIGGIVLMALMVFVRQAILPKAKINPDHLPLINAAATALAFTGLSLLTPEVSIGQALYNGFITSGVATLAWEIAGKYLFENVLGADLYDKGKKK